MPSIKQYLMTELLTELKAMAFVPEEQDVYQQPIDPDAILFRKVGATEQVEENEEIPEDTVPGILVSARAMRQNIAGGECHRDEWDYIFLLQIIDGDRSPGDNYASYWAWQEQIVQQFNFQNLQNVVPQALGCVFAVWLDMIDDVDERLWARHSKFVSGVQIRIRVYINRTNLVDLNG